MSGTTTAAGPAAGLTDGTGISPITGTKVVKDLVLDFLLSAAAALGAGATLDALDIGSVIAAPEVAGLAVFGALVRTLFRAGLRWATTP